VDFLMETLENLFAQSRTPDEIIIVDDNSTDQTQEKVNDRYGDRVTLIRSKSSGPGAARNLGFNKSSGDLIKFIDSDDLITLNLIEDQEATLMKSGDPGVYSSYFKASVNQEGNWEQEDVIMHDEPIPGNSIRHLMIRGFFIPIPAFMFRREILEQAGPWNEKIIAYEDFEYLWRLTKISDSFAHSNRSAMLYRIHGKQTTENNVSNSRREKDKLDCFIPIVNEIESESSFSWYEKQLIGFHFTKIKNLLSEFENTGAQIKLTLMQRIVGMLEQVKNKLDRMNTGTHWGKAYMPNDSKERFEFYLKLITNKKTQL